jgi:hypothetical protein
MYTLDVAKYGKELNGAVSLAHLAGSVMLHYYDLDYSVSVKENEHSPESAIFTEVDGRIDKIVLYPILPKSGETKSVPKFWDITAADIILHEAGGIVTSFFGEEYKYNIPEFRCLPGVLMDTAAAHSLALASLHNPCRVGSS